MSLTVYRKRRPRTSELLIDAMKDPGVQKFVLGVLSSPPAMLMGGMVIQSVQWIGEHVEINPQRKLRTGAGNNRLVGWMSTNETSNMNRVGVFPPLMCNIARVGDAGADTVVAAAEVATKALENTKQQGLLPSIWKFLAGG